MSKTKNKVGRPPKYDNVEDLQNAIDSYFDNCKPEHDELGNVIAFNFPSVTGLTLALGFCDKKSLRQYREKEEFAPLIKRALLKVESHYEQRLNMQSPTGAIFALKNMGWEDKHQVDASVKGDFFDWTDEQIKNELRRLGG